YRRRAFERGTRYQLHVAGGPRAVEVLQEAGVVDRALAPLERPPRRVVGRSCCRGAYLRGALLGAGPLTLAPSLHLELRTAARAGASRSAARGRRLAGDAAGAAARDRRAPCALPVPVAARAGPALRAARDEGGGAQAPAATRQARAPIRAPFRTKP